MNIGSIYNTNYLPSFGQYIPPAPRQTSPTTGISPAAPAARPYTQGSNALYLSLDGDSAEISNIARGLSLLEPNQRPAIPGIGDPMEPASVENDMLKALETQRVCQTCENRKYVDRSDDASVSFQTPTSISPNMAAAAVASHEQEHVRNEQAKAHRDDREVVSQTVTLTYDTCPECGKQYVSGGTTRTTTIDKSDNEESFNLESEAE